MEWNLLAIDSLHSLPPSLSPLIFTPSSIPIPSTSTYQEWLETDQKVFWLEGIMVELKKKTLPISSLQSHLTFIMSVFSNAKCLAQEASWFREVKRVPGIKQSPVNLAGINWAEFLYTAMLWIYTLITVRKKMIIVAFFLRIAAQVFCFFFFYPITEFNLDKNLLKHSFFPLWVKIYLFLIFFKEIMWGLLILGKKILFSNTPPSHSTKPF